MQELEQILEAAKALNKIKAKTDLSEFCLYSSSTYTLKWFHKLIASKCNDLFNGKIKRLMIFVPPQHGKSYLISQLFPAWALGRNPKLKIVGCSYSAALSSQFSRSIQRIIDSEEYQNLFPETYLNGSNVRTDTKGYLRNVDIFETVGHGGFYKSVGIGGSLTGTPVDIAIIDDPVKDAIEANSITYRERVWDWYNSVLTTRLHNDSKQLFIMTRWHEDDLAGRILQAEGDKWDVVKIPAICEADGDGFGSPRKIGEALWQEKHSLEKLEAQKARSPREFASLYQQSPTIQGGNIVQSSWFGSISYENFKQIHHGEAVNFFIDTAYTNNTNNDPTGIIATTKIGTDLYVLDAKKVHMKFPDLIRFLPVYVNEHGYTNKSSIRIEPKANGLSVIDQLKESTHLNVMQTPSPRESKETRLNAVSATIEAGRVVLVDGVWNVDFVDEICGFPAKAHDEYVDVLCYAINYYFNDKRKTIDIQRLSRIIY